MYPVYMVQEFYLYLIHKNVHHHTMQHPCAYEIYPGNAEVAREWADLHIHCTITIICGIFSLRLGCSFRLGCIIIGTTEKVKE